MINKRKDNWLKDQIEENIREVDKWPIWMKRIANSEVINKKTSHGEISKREGLLDRKKR